MNSKIVILMVIIGCAALVSAVPSRGGSGKTASNSGVNTVSQNSENSGGRSGTNQQLSYEAGNIVDESNKAPSQSVQRDANTVTDSDNVANEAAALARQKSEESFPITPEECALNNSDA